MSENLQNILTLLDNVKQIGEGRFQASCPNHRDNNPSFTITEKSDGTILIHCHGRCSHKEVMQALGLENKDLFPPTTNGHVKRRKKVVKSAAKAPVATVKNKTDIPTVIERYDYEDEKGVLLFQVTRMSDKQFPQRRPNPNGGWINNVDGVRKVLYKLPLLTDVPADAFIYICSGEKDADRLISLGFYATTNPCGEGKSSLCDSSVLHGHHVIILEDNDEAGRKHVIDVAECLHGKVLSSRILALPDLPEKGDVSDFLDAGNDVEDLDRLATQAKAWEPTANNDAGIESPPLKLTGDSEPELKFQIESTFNAVKVGVTALLNDVVLHVESFNLKTSSKRTEFAKIINKKASQFSLEFIEDELLKLAAENAPKHRLDEIEEVVLTRSELLELNDEQTEKALADMPDDVVEEAMQMLLDEDLVKQIASDIQQMGVVGERPLALTTYTAGTSRLLQKPVSTKTQGLTASGKSFVNKQVAKLFPPEAIIVATSLSNQALYYLPAGSLIHKFVAGGERSRLENDDTAEATRAMREMQSEGELTKIVTASEGGCLKTKIIHQDGPISFVESTTVTKIFDEDANRCLVSATDEGTEQTALVKQALADEAQYGSRDNSQTIAKHHAAQRLLKRVEVRIPYAQKLNSLIPNDKIEARRAVGHILEMIKAVALLHQYQRTEDVQHGSIIEATYEDYGVALEMLKEPISRSLGGQISPTAKNLFSRLKDRFSLNEEFTTSEAAKSDNNIKSNMSQYLTILVGTGAVELVEANKGSKPNKWKITSDLPDFDDASLPTVEQLKDEER